MAGGLTETEADCAEPGILDPEDFARRVREFALDACQLLNCSDSPIDEMIRLYHCAWILHRNAPGVQPSAIRRWLIAARRTIDARIQSWSLTELESLVG